MRPMRSINRTAAFTAEEYRRRVAAAQVRIADAGLDALLCHNLANTCYLTGFETIGSYGYGHYAALLGREGDPVLFASDFESHNAALFAWMNDVVTYDVHDDTAGGPVRALAISADGRTATNHAGGINGGITNGNDLVFRVAVKPTSSTHQKQRTINITSGKMVDLEIEGRHDTCIALRVPVVVEAAAAVVLAEGLKEDGRPGTLPYG